MQNKRLWIAAGLTLSIALTGFVLLRLDWVRFWRALAGVDLLLLLPVVLGYSGSIMLRALRWIFISQEPLRLYSRFWAATVSGYLGNYLYPLRAGEVIRVITLNRLAKVPIGRATTSAVLDRVSDGMVMGPLILAVIAIHSGQVLGIGAVIQVVGFSLLAITALILFGVWGHRFEDFILRLSAYIPGFLGERIPDWYSQALQLLRSYRRLHALVPILAVTVLVFFIDSLTIWILLFAFGLSLPFTAALTLEVLLAASSILPSAPGYVGIYQAASVLALGLYGIDAGSAVAVSVVIQLLCLIVVVLKAGGIAYHYKLQSPVILVSPPANPILAPNDDTP